VHCARATSSSAKFSKTVATSSAKVELGEFGGCGLGTLKNDVVDPQQSVIRDSQKVMLSEIAYACRPASPPHQRLVNAGCVEPRDESNLTLQDLRVPGKDPIGNQLSTVVFKLRWDRAFLQDDSPTLIGCDRRCERKQQGVTPACSPDCIESRNAVSGSPEALSRTKAQHLSASSPRE
jgi:hypothetical protein